MQKDLHSIDGFQCRYCGVLFTELGSLLHHVDQEDHEKADALAMAVILSLPEYKLTAAQARARKKVVGYVDRRGNGIRVIAVKRSRGIVTFLRQRLCDVHMCTLPEDLFDSLYKRSSREVRDTLASMLSLAVEYGAEPSVVDALAKVAWAPKALQDVAVHKYNEANEREARQKTNKKTPRKKTTRRRKKAAQ